MGRKKVHKPKKMLDRDKADHEAFYQKKKKEKVKEGFFNVYACWSWLLGNG